MEEGIEDLRDV